MKKIIKSKFIGYYKPDKVDDDWTGGNTWPFLNLPGKGKCNVKLITKQTGLSEQCHKQQLTARQHLRASKFGQFSFKS